MAQFGEQSLGEIATRAKQQRSLVAACMHDQGTCVTGRFRFQTLPVGCGNPGDAGVWCSVNGPRVARVLGGGEVACDALSLMQVQGVTHPIAVFVIPVGWLS